MNAKNEKATITGAEKMGHSNMFTLILSMGFPAALSMLVQSMYNIVDSIFVSQINENALTAVSLSFPVQNAIISVAVGTAIGINSLISRSLGAKKVQYAEEVAKYGIILGVVSSLVFVLFGLFCCEWFFSLFSNDPQIISMGVNYLSIVCIVSFGCFIQISMEKILQSTGNMIYPMITQLIGAIINIILDPIFIFGMFGLPAMGTSGAALATVIGQIIAMMAGIYFLFKRQNVLKVHFNKFKFDFSIVKNIYRVGIPVMMIQMLSSIVILFVNNVLVTLSTVGVSIIGIYIKLQSFVLMPVFGVMQGVMPIAGYNFGAKNKERVMSSYKIALAIIMVISIGGFLLFLFGSRPLLSMFSATEEMYKVGIPALQILAFSFVFSGFGITSSMFFQSIGYGMSSLILSLFRQMILILPAIYILPNYIGINGVWLAYPLAEGVSAIICVFLLKNIYDKSIKNLGYTDDTEILKERN